MGAVVQRRSFVLVVALLLTTVLGLAGQGLMPAGAQDEARRGLVVNVTTDDAWASDMALNLATNAAKEGLDTIVFLNVRGVYLADAGRKPATAGGSELDFAAKMAAFQEAGGRVIVCPSCAAEAGLEQADLLEGAVIGEPGGLIAFLADPNFNVISYGG